VTDYDIVQGFVWAIG